MLKNGSKAGDRFEEKMTGHVRAVAKRSDAVRKMYQFDPEYEDIPADRGRDLFYEKQLTKEKGLIQKYEGRALFLLSYTCAANCRFCERQDRVGVGLDAFGRVTDEEIDRAVSYLSNRTDIKEVIFSGGDPLTNPKGLLRASRGIGSLDHIDVLRIHSRFLVQYPQKFNLELMQEVKATKDPYFFSVHINHPDEITLEVEDILRKLRGQGFILLNQAVFLKGVNDSTDVLESLFHKLFCLGVRPYYIYHCQPIATTMRFVMNISDEVAIMTSLREKLSGLAVPQHVIELQHTTGKIIAPTNHWEVNWDTIRDYSGTSFELHPKTMVPQRDQ